MRKQAGFTLIELVMVIIVLGILAAIAIPRFVDLSGDAFTAAAHGMEGAVKGAMAVSIAATHDFVDVDTLVTYINGENIAAVATGVEVDIDGDPYIVRTYIDAFCGTATLAADNEVQCVGTIDPATYP